MRQSPLPVVAVVALLTLAGCAGLSATETTDASLDASPDDFPNASAIDQSVFDTHATAMANTSFTLTYEKTQKDRKLTDRGNFTYKNSTATFFVEPAASQYLAKGSGFYLGENVTTYSNGNTTFDMWWKDGERTVKKVPAPLFDESSEKYLWGGWFGNTSGSRYPHAAIDADFEREGVETFWGVPVMRYEATGLDALADSWAGGENTSSFYEEFSATILIDEDGVVRHYEYEIVWADTRTRKVSTSFTLSELGSTDVEKPDWVANATAGS